MKRKSDFSKKYLSHRLVSFLETVELNICTHPIQNVVVIGLERPRVKCMYKSRTLTITQRVSKEEEKNKKEIVRALYREAVNLFSVYGFLVNIELEYE